MRNNNFDILRLMCALLVIVSHSYALLVIYGEEPLLQGTGWLLASGIGLCGFFTISGYLILQSLVTSKNIFSYLAKRCLRIFHGLLVCLILVVVACSFFYTGEGNYWTQYETYSFIWNNLSLYDLQWEIPGVFVNNPYDASIDGSLWTLAYEYSLYLCIIVLFFMRKHKGVIAGLSILALALILTKNIFFATKLANAYYFNLSLNLFMPFAQYFVTGMLLQNRQTFRTDKARLIIIGICAASAICITIIHTYVNIKPLVMLFVSALFIMLGELYWKPVSDGLKRIGDMSYGTYIYAFPIQQMLIASIPGITPIWLMVLTSISVLPIAFASWHIVEKRALSLKKYL